MAAYGEFLKANGEQPVTWRRAASMDEVLQQADLVRIHLLRTKCVFWFYIELLLIIKIHWRCFSVQISLHPVLDKTTYHLVNKERLALMKKVTS